MRLQAMGRFRRGLEGSYQFSRGFGFLVFRLSYSPSSLLRANHLFISTSLSPAAARVLGLRRRGGWRQQRGELCSRGGRRSTHLAWKGGRAVCRSGFVVPSSSITAGRERQQVTKKCAYLLRPLSSRPPFARSFDRKAHSISVTLASPPPRTATDPPLTSWPSPCARRGT